MATQSGAAKKATAESAKKKIKALGLVLDGPPVLPGTFAFDLLEVSGGNDAGVLQLYKTVIGDEQWAQVREALAKRSSKDGGFGALDELLTAILDAYGMTAGE